MFAKMLHAQLQLSCFETLGLVQVAGCWRGAGGCRRGGAAFLRVLAGVVAC